MTPSARLTGHEEERHQLTLAACRHALGQPAIDKAPVVGQALTLSEAAAAAIAPA